MDNGIRTLNPLLRMAAVAGVETAVELHIRRGDDLDAKDRNGATPLMLAAAKRKASIVRMLLAAGVDLTTTDPQGRSALAHAELGGCAQCVELIRGASKGHGLAQLSETVFEAASDTVTVADRIGEASPAYIAGVPAAGRSLTLATIGDIKNAGTVTGAIAPTKDEPTKHQELAIESPVANEAKLTRDASILAAPLIEQATGSMPVSDSFDLGGDIRDLGWDDGWEVEPDSVAPAGDDTVAEGARALQDGIRRHSAIDTDAVWADVELFLPDKALPLTRDDGEGSAVRALFFRSLREGSVPEEAVIKGCLDATGERDEEVEWIFRSMSSHRSGAWEATVPAHGRPRFRAM